MRCRDLLGMAPKPPTTAPLVTLMKGPVVTAGSGARKTCATKFAFELLGFNPVLSVTSVPLEVKLSPEVHITEHGVKGAAQAGPAP